MYSGVFSYFNKPSITQWAGFVLWMAICLSSFGTTFCTTVLAEVSPEESVNIKQSMDGIFQQDQFKHLRDHKSPFDLDKLLNDSARSPTKNKPVSSKTSSSSSSGWFDWLPSWDFTAFGGALGMMIQGAMWFVIVVVCLALVYFIGKAIMAYERKRQSTPDNEKDILSEQQIITAPGEKPVNKYWAQAKDLASKGEYALAITQLLQGAMSDIERRQQIRFRRGLTSYDYLRAVRAEPSRHQALQEIVHVYEPIGYGRRPATVDKYQQSLHQFEAEFLATNSSPDS